MTANKETWKAHVAAIMMTLLLISQPVLASTSAIPEQFYVTDIKSGQRVRFNAKHKELIVLHAWASWCSYCRREHRLWQTLTKQKGVRYIAMTFREQPAQSMRYLEHSPAPFDQFVYLNQAQAKVINVKTIPDTMIICQDKILYRRVGSMNSLKFNQVLGDEVARAQLLCKQMHQAE